MLELGDGVVDLCGVEPERFTPAPGATVHRNDDQEDGHNAETVDDQESLTLLSGHFGCGRFPQTEECKDSRIRDPIAAKELDVGVPYEEQQRERNAEGGKVLDRDHQLVEGTRHLQRDHEEGHGESEDCVAQGLDPRDTLWAPRDSYSGFHDFPPRSGVSTFTRAMKKNLVEKVARLPRKPGVYLFKGAGDEILYVGKAGDLRARVRSYVQPTAMLPHKTSVLVQKAADLDYFVTESEVEALLLESNLIKEHDPRFNVILRDDKSYPYIKVTLQNDYPRVFVTRRVVSDGGRYFGPYTHVKYLRRNLAMIKDLFPVRSCRYNLLRERPSRPCLDYHIHRCDAPCVEYVSREEYRAMISQVVSFLEGDTRAAERVVEARMRSAAERLQFERAAQYKRQLDQLSEIRDGQRMTSLSGDDRDVVGLARLGDEACGVVLRVREGRLLDQERLVLGNVEGAPDEEALSLFLTRYYARAQDLPSEVLVPFDFADRPLLEEAVRRRADRGIVFRVPKRGDKARQVALAEKNALLYLEERRLHAEARTERAADNVLELQAELRLTRIPRRIACVDISTIQGTDSVGSIVTFENGKPRKAGYRKFRIKYIVEGQDDFAMMAEVVERYFRGLLDHGEALPDLLVIDGGKGQLSAARGVLEEMGVLDEIDTIAIAKREEEIYKPGGRDPVWLPRRSRALQLVQHIRNEAHRFAVAYHRSLRTKRTIASELDRVAGIGPRRRAALLVHFGSTDRIRQAPVDEIAKVPGFSTKLAERVKAALEVVEPEEATAS
jgi:excinuclease ABC subunit C